MDGYSLVVIFVALMMIVGYAPRWDLLMLDDVLDDEDGITLCLRRFDIDDYLVGRFLIDLVSL